MSAFVDRALDFEERWSRQISIALAIYFWLGVAVYARFVTLPDVPRVDEKTIFFWSSVAFNAVWWGFARPAMDKRKRLRETENNSVGDA